MINKVAKNPKKVFLMDALGAFLTAIILVLMIVFKAVANFGMPLWALTLLALMAVCFSVYSFWCLFFAKTKWLFFLKIILVANGLYCVLTATTLIFFYSDISIVESIYFPAEISLILLLIFFEWKVLKIGGLAQENR